MVLFLLLILYFIPSVVAVMKKKTNAGAITTLNILLGWTLIGWIISLVWAMTNEPPSGSAPAN